MSLVDNNINGDPSALSVDRAGFELRRGGAFGIIDGHSSVLVAAVETLGPKLLKRLQLAGCQQLLILSSERTEAMGLTTDNTDPIALTLPRKFDVAMARQLAGIAPSHSQPNPDTFPVQNCNRASAAGLQLAKKARLVPALIAVELPSKVLVDSVVSVHIMESFVTTDNRLDVSYSGSVKPACLLQGTKIAGSSYFATPSWTKNMSRSRLET